MGNWFKARWRAYLESSDPDEAMAASTPSATLAAGGTLIAVLLGLAYVPAFARLSQFRNAWEAVVLVLVGMTCTHVAWRHQCRGTVGSLATLLDNTFYSAALAFAAMNTEHDVGVALAIVHAMMLAAFPGQLYAFSFLLGLSIATPVVLLLVLLQPQLSIAIITICSVILMLVFSEVTRGRRVAKQREVRLEQALGAADRLADDSVQAALTTTLLTLGHFLHELRNYQTAISLSLEYVSLKAGLTEPVASALEEAQSAQRRQEALLNEVINDLRGRSRPVESSFLLADAVRNSVVENQGVDVIVNKADVDFEVAGNPEHLRIVLLNLLRNAEQAGARTVSIVWRPDTSGQEVQIMVHDDGQGIPEDRRQTLFESFALSDKPGGTGLGLYLVRRYIEVLGGQVRIDAGPLGGAAFIIRLPAHARPRPESAPRSSKRLRST